MSCLCKGVLKTLSLKRALEADQFFLFGLTPGQPRHRAVRRTIILGNHHMGQAGIYLPPGEDEWLCPYFDPVTRCLKFRKRDGQDAEAVLNLNRMAHSKRMHILLHMARAEGLLDKVPGGYLISFHPRS